VDALVPERNTLEDVFLSLVETENQSEHDDASGPRAGTAG
jgi:hypothetical protein